MLGAGDNEQSTGGLRRPQSGGLARRSSTADRIGNALRAPRSGRSYDYLGGEEGGAKATAQYNYMRNPQPPRNPSKSFDYLCDDQNREHPAEGARRFFAAEGAKTEARGPMRPHHQHAPPPASLSDAADDTRSSEEEEEREDDAAVRALLEVIQDQLTGKSVPEPVRMQHGTPIAAPAIGGKGANAGTVALIAVGFCNILLNLHNTQKYTLSTPIASAAIMLGGGSQLIVGQLDFSKGNSFGSNAFMSYGAFWLTIACRWMIPNNSFGGPDAVYPTSDYFEGIFLQLFFIHSMMFCICTLRMNVGIFLVFFAIMFTFLLTGLGNMLKEDTLTVLEVGGYVGITSGVFSYYVGFAELVNEVYDRTILPVFPIADLPFFAKQKTEEGGAHGDEPDDENAGGQQAVPTTVHTHPADKASHEPLSGDTS